MVIDTSDNTIGICEGMLWVSMEDVAEALDADPRQSKQVIAWLTEHASEYNDTLMDDIVDFATERLVEIVEGHMDDPSAKARF